MARWKRRTTGLTMFGSAMRPTSILMIKSIQGTAISGELNHRKMVCSDSCKDQGPGLGVQQNLKP